MLPILEFIFQSFWHWLGTVFLVALVCGAIASARPFARQ